jgi:NADPH2:quinone reductase
MKAVLCSRFGGPDDLELKDIPAPAAGPGEAVVTVKAAALNFFDTLLIAGKYQYKPPFPFSPASEFAGVVASVGPGVAEFAPGDRVVGHMGAGAAREQIVIKADRLAHLPAGLDFDRAAGLTVTYGTTVHALKDRAQLKPGETLAVLGKLMGARVIACASSADKLDFARRHGADETVNYDEEDLKEALRRVTDGRGVDVVYDPVGGPYAEA